jgi:hypothetical protein
MILRRSKPQAQRFTNPQDHPKSPDRRQFIAFSNS